MIQSKPKIKDVMIQAGKYWLGDPCYAFSGDHDRWMKLLESADYTNVDRDEMMIASIDDGKCQFVASSTAYGDGEYEVTGFECKPLPVDAGLIGLVPVGHETCDGKPFGMRMIEFDRPFLFEVVNDDGKIEIGHVTVHTGDEPEDDGLW